MAGAERMCSHRTCGAGRTEERPNINDLGARTRSALLWSSRSGVDLVGNQPGRLSTLAPELGAELVKRPSARSASTSFHTKVPS